MAQGRGPSGIDPYNRSIHSSSRRRKAVRRRRLIAGASGLLVVIVVLVIVLASGGMMRLLEGTTGRVVSSLKLNGNTEASPAVFNDMIVVGTRSQKIYGIKIS